MFYLLELDSILQDNLPLKLDIPEEIPALTVNKMCGSSMKAIMLAANAIRAGESEILIAGGMESMSQSPFTVARAQDGKVSMEKPLIV